MSGRKMWPFRIFKRKNKVSPEEAASEGEEAAPEGNEAAPEGNEAAPEGNEAALDTAVASTSKASDVENLSKDKGKPKKRVTIEDRIYLRRSAKTPPKLYNKPLDEDEEMPAGNEEYLLKWPRQVNRRIFDVIRGEPPAQIPVWIMGNTVCLLGGYETFYRQYDYLKLIHTPELACELTMLPVNRFEFDAAMIFSDILVIPEALGMKLIMNPTLSFAIPLTPENMDDILNKDSVIDKLNYIGKTLTLTRKEMEGKSVLIGAAAAPWTLMCYMIEGQSSDTWEKAQAWLYSNPQKSHQLIDILTNVIIDFCVMQVVCGAQMIQIMDTKADILSKHLYVEFFLNSIRKINMQIKFKLIGKHGIFKVPMIYFGNGGHSILKEVADSTSFDIYGLSHMINTHTAQKIVGDSIFQGNLDPYALFAPPEKVTEMTVAMLERFEGSGLIANVGDDIAHDTPLEGVCAFLDTVRSYRRYGSLMHI